MVQTHLISVLPRPAVLKSVTFCVTAGLAISNWLRVAILCKRFICKIFSFHALCFISFWAQLKTEKKRRHAPHSFIFFCISISFSNFPWLRFPFTLTRCDALKTCHASIHIWASAFGYLIHRLERGHFIPHKHPHETDLCYEKNLLTRFKVWIFWGERGGGGGGSRADFPVPCTAENNHSSTVDAVEPWCPMWDYFGITLFLIIFGHRCRRAIHLKGFISSHTHPSPHPHPLWSLNIDRRPRRDIDTEGGNRSS